MFERSANVFDLPPYPYLAQILSHCPKAASTYISIWRARDENNAITVNKSEIRNSFLITPTRFKNDMLVLVKEGLISVEESPKMLQIDVVGWDEEE